MIHLVHTFGILASLFIFGFCLVSGVLRASDLLEEYPNRARKLLKWSGIVTVIAHISLWCIDGFPWLPSLFSILCQAVFATNLQTFPLTEVTSPRFIASIIACLCNHFAWFFYFIDPHHYHALFTPVEICLFFLVVVWFVPVLYFLALTEASSQLPSHDSTTKPRRPNLLNTLLHNLSLRSHSDSSPSSSKAE